MVRGWYSHWISLSNGMVRIRIFPCHEMCRKSLNRDCFRQRTTVRVCFTYHNNQLICWRWRRFSYSDVENTEHRKTTAWKTRLLASVRKCYRFAVSFSSKDFGIPCQRLTSPNTCFAEYSGDGTRRPRCYSVFCGLAENLFIARIYIFEFCRRDGVGSQFSRFHFFVSKFSEINARFECGRVAS